jgi:putative ABC transport system permease protein
MSVLFRISRRNLMEHKAKTYIIGILIALGVVVLIVGSAFMDTATLGIQRAFIDNYTGHIMISGVADGKVSLFGVQSPGRMEETPTIPEFSRVFNHVRELDGVTALSPQLTGFGIIGMPEVDGRAFTLMFGIEPESYRKLFDNVEIIEGRYLKPGETGVLMSTLQIERIKKEIADEQDVEVEDVDVEFRAGDMLRVSSFGNAGFKIREVPIRGIFDFKLTSEGVGADMITYIDAQTLRALQGLSVVTRDIRTLDSGETYLLQSEENMDALFSEEEFTVEESDEVDLSEDALLSFLDEQNDDKKEEEQVSAADTGAGPSSGPWQYILLKLEDPRNMNLFTAGLNIWFAREGIAAEAGTWEAAAGPFATTADVIRSVFNIAIIIIGIVAVIIMMNTLVISIIERTPEIGTMRALGAKKSFVWRMFLYETLSVTVVFGIAGIILALLIVLVLNIIGIPANNTFLKILFAGDELHPSVSPLSVVTSMGIILVIGFLSHLYPVSVALKIQPIRAIQAK